MNLKDFSNKNVEHFKNKQKQQEQPEVETNIDEEEIGEMEQRFSEENPEEYQNVKQAFDKYSQMDEQSLMDELIKTTQAQKEAGTLDLEKIKSTYNILYPMLNEQQKKKLDEIIKVIS